VPHEVRVVSAHRTPDLLFEYAAARARGLRSSSRAPAARRTCPAWRGQDDAARARRAGAVEDAERPRLAAVDRADAGRHPGRTLAIGVAGATNAALLAASILGNKHPAIARPSRRVPGRADRQGARPARPRTRASRHEDRRHRRGPARTHAGPGGLSARAAVPFLDSSADAPGAQVAPISRARSTTATASRDSRAASTWSPTTSRTSGRGAPGAVAESRPCCGRASSAARFAGPAAREAAVHASCGIPTPPFRAVDSLADLRAAVSALGLPWRAEDAPARLRRQGPALPAQASPTSSRLGSARQRAVILEGFVDFEREVSIVGARSTRGESRAYPIVANTHATASCA
jgi:5-(carboxyamino)imidazole ribonucleotide mutase